MENGSEMKGSSWILLDIGSHSIKWAIVNASVKEISIQTCPNLAMDRQGASMEETVAVRDPFRQRMTHPRRPFNELGQWNDWDAQLTILDHLLEKLDTTQCHLMVIEPWFQHSLVQRLSDEIYFDVYCFQSVTRVPSAVSLAWFVSNGDWLSFPCQLVIDLGHSATWIVPVFQGQPVKEAIVKCSLGSQHLVKRLQSWITARQYNVMEETPLMEHVLETCCFVQSKWQSMNAETLFYVLPDFVDLFCGHSTKEQPEQGQCLTLKTERFMVPEMLFRPQDADLTCAGLVECIAESISRLPELDRDFYWSQIYLIGGMAQMNGLVERLYEECRCLAPVDVDVAINRLERPAQVACSGLRSFIGKESQTREMFHSKSLPSMLGPAGRHR